jgi:organic radical activating enzyme
MKQNIKRLDIMVAYSCNLSCKGCISLSDFPRNGVEKFEDLEKSITYWSQFIEPDVISIFGGEPLLHPKLLKILKAVRENWSESTIRLITNGYLLDRYEPGSWYNFDKFEIQVSLHRSDHKKIITNKISKILAQKTGWKTQKIKDTQHHKFIEFTNDNFTIYMSKFKDFVMPYKLIDGKPVPYNSNPIVAHSLCGSPDTPILYRGSLYKCAAIANLLEVADKKVYSYNKVSSVEDLHLITDFINIPESICSICPDNLDNLVDHFDKETVHVKQVIN